MKRKDIGVMVFAENPRSRLNERGEEIPDPRPVELPIGFERPESIQDMIRRLVQDPMIRQDLDSREVETFDEADDFETEDDGMPVSPHEETFDPLHLLARDQEVRSGTVRDRTPEEVREALKVIEQYNASQRLADVSAAPAAPAPTAPAKVA